MVLLLLSGVSTAGWIEYATGANGDVYFFDETRVKKQGSQVSVWNRVRYKTSIMGASSYQSLLNIDCAEGSEVIAQSTFFSDREWTVPAMATNTLAKPKKLIGEDSATARLADRVCGE